MYGLRKPVVADADRLGEIHTISWQVAYRGMMPDEYLDGLDPQDRISTWRNGLESGGRPDGIRRVAEHIETGRIDGFVLAGPARHDEPVGEIYLIYLDPAVFGSGVGGLLFDAASAALTSTGFTEAILWVHPDNERARGFYEHKGWTFDGESRVETLDDIAIPEVRYRGIL
jgi:GNAT superfamily N-acetyltransferase